MNDRQFTLIMEKLAGIEATQSEHKKTIENLSLKVTASLKADDDNRRLITVIEDVQKELLALKDELVA